MEYKKTAFHCEAGVATITMDCPENLNAIDVDMAKELLERLYQCDRSSEVKVVVLKGGVRAFSAGGDIRYLYDNIQRGVVESSELVVLVGKLALAMKQLNKLVICAVSGSAAGAGANLALSGDFVVCSENARFIQAFVGIALVPDTGGPYLLSRSIGAQRALEMCITGRPVPAEEASGWGWSTRSVPERNWRSAPWPWPASWPPGRSSPIPTSKSRSMAPRSTTTTVTSIRWRRRQ